MTDVPYLNLDVDYFSHRKTVRLIGLLGRGAEALPIRVWAYCGKHHPESGSLASYSTQEIETAVGWWGTSGALVAAMVKIGFLDQTDDGYACHDWLEYEGHLAAFHVRAKRAAKERWDRYRQARQAGSNAEK